MQVTAKFVSLMVFFAVAMNTGTTSADTDSYNTGNSSQSPPEPAGPPGTIPCRITGIGWLSSYDGTSHNSYNEMDWDIYSDFIGSVTQIQHKKILQISFYPNNISWDAQGLPILGPNPNNLTTSYYGKNMMMIDLTYPNGSTKCIKIVLTNFPDDAVKKISVTLNKQLFIEGPMMIPGYVPPTRAPVPTLPTTTTKSFTTQATTTTPAGPGAVCGTRWDIKVNGKPWVINTLLSLISYQSRSNSASGNYLKLGYNLGKPLSVVHSVVGLHVWQFDIKYANSPTTKCLYANFNNFQLNLIQWNWDTKQDRLNIEVNY